MEKPHIGRYGFLIALGVLVHAGMVWALTDNGTPRDAMMVSANDLSAGCSAFTGPQDRYRENVNDQRQSPNGVMVAEDMRCRQCRGKCTADNLRCRSQCLGDSTCLTQCDEMKSTCETTCKQLFDGCPRL